MRWSTPACASCSRDPAEALVLVDQRDERPARSQAPQVFTERGDGAAGPPRRASGGVRRDDRAQMRPQPVPERQRFGIGDVEACAPQQPLGEGGEQVVAVDDLAACNVDQDRAPFHETEEVAREQMMRGLGQGQRNDDHVGRARRSGRRSGRQIASTPGSGGTDSMSTARMRIRNPTPRDGHLPARPAEAHDAQGQVVQLALLTPDGLPVADSPAHGWRCGARA